MSLYVIKPITIFVSSIFYLLMTITVYIDNELVLAQYLVEIDAYKSVICRVFPPRYPRGNPRAYRSEGVACDSWPMETENLSSRSGRADRDVWLR